MTKTYNRKKIQGILFIFLGLIIGISVFKDKTFVLIYDGFRLIFSILSLIAGFWGLITPLAKINETIVELKLSLFSTKIINLKKISKIDYNENKQTLKFDSFAFNLKLMNNNHRKDFISDLKAIQKQINE